MFHIVHILKWNQNPNECLGGKERGGKQLKYEGNNDKKKNTMESKFVKVGTYTKLISHGTILISCSNVLSFFIWK